MSLSKTYLGLLLGLLLNALGTINTHGQEATDSLMSDTIEVNVSQAEQDPENGISDYAQGLINRFDKSPLLVTILYVVIFYSIVTMITLLIIILLNRRRLEREDKLKG
ncbi:MAG: hypothetical protein U9R49_08010, partial [Bacteroidota bacterium]|nr:hypothetical protein [Bacteroidota bacterium]